MKIDNGVAKVRKMTIDDIDSVFEIELSSFTVPWTKEAFENELNQNQFSHYIVLEYDGKVVGYMGMWMIVDEVHITNIAVLPDYRGYGFGKQLLQTAKEYALEKEARTMTLEVRMSNEVAQNLYKSLGFQFGGIRKKYYTDNLEDAIVMWVEL